MQWIDFQQTIEQRSNRERLDFEQDKARNFSLQGHALVRGVAGSGKSLVLRNRVEKLIEEKLDRILVLSYNRFMKGWIESALAKKGLNVECSTFHQWSYQKLGYEYRFDRDADLRQKILDLASISNLNYQAVLVDEAQDFYDEWFQALLTVVDSQTNSLFFVYDNTQSVYGQAHRRKNNWSWSKLGIDVVGRAQIFDLNYRNSPEILELAWKFVQPALNQAEMKFDRKENSPSIDKIIEPKKKLARSSGIAPALVQIDRAAMPIEIAKQVNLAIETYPKSSIGILTHPAHESTKALKLAISKALYQLGILHHAPTKSQERMGNVVDRPFVIVDSWNALKGLEFDAVIMAGIDLAVEQSDDRDFAEKAGLYTAMTRAKDHLVMLYEDKTSIVEQLETALNAPNQLLSEN